MIAAKRYTNWNYSNYEYWNITDEDRPALSARELLRIESTFQRLRLR